MELGRVVSAARGDERGFVHKRFFGAIKGAVGGLLGGPSGIVGGALGGFIRPGRPDVFRPVPGLVVPTTVIPSGLGRAPIRCGPGFRADPLNVTCLPFAADVRLRQISAPQEPTISTGLNGRGDERQLLPFGEAVMGRFGAGMKPAVFSQQRRACPRGSVLGAPEPDGSSICYNKRDLSNKERAWPRGRRPLLTGGEMRAISTASSAANKLQRKQKQLESLGLLKRPAARSRRALPAIPSATHELAIVHK